MLKPRNSSVSPKPDMIRPMFSMDEYASRRFMSVCTAANTIPKSALTSPAASAITPHHQSGKPMRSSVTRSIP